MPIGYQLSCYNTGTIVSSSTLCPTGLIRRSCNVMDRIYYVRAYAYTFCACLLLSGCDVAQAVSYSKECLVSACGTGWKVSSNKTTCDANVCVCPNGTPASGEACTVDGANMCQSCDTGFKLREDKTACDGQLRPLVVAVGIDISWRRDHPNCYPSPCPKS